MKCYGGLNRVQTGTKEEVQKEAMKNPEVQAILADPVMQQILQQMQTDPMVHRFFYLLMFRLLKII